MHFMPPSLSNRLRTFLRKADATPAFQRLDGAQQVPLSAIIAQLEAMSHASAETPLTKGRPCIETIRATLARRLLELLSSAPADGIDAGTLETARRLAAIDPSETAAYGIFTSLCALANHAALDAVRGTLGPDVVMHVSCQPRMDRARASWISFAPAEAEGIRQVIVVGSAEAHLFHFDKTSGVLTVPAPDTYEHLPSKVIAATLFFALTGVVSNVLKVDDDHRLRSVSRLQAALSMCRSPYPVQLGDLRKAAFPGDHTRVWHFGKCKDPYINERPFGLLNPPRWNNGASGYLLNRASLNLLSWCATQFADYISIGLYEDMVVSDLLDRHRARLVPFEMNAVLAMVDHY